ncbi:MAG: DUF2007 domain-containing protein [Verrucomicrobiales bacterium]|nr:DUF2007 domain-containing protein [Verrucomicrobiales bacterium]
MILVIDSSRRVPHAGPVELETVFETLNATEAQLIRSRLEAAGLSAEVDPEIDPLSIEGFTLPAGGIQIKVPSAQAADARALLAASEQGNE